jgi:hypothetical protein
MNSFITVYRQPPNQPRKQTFVSVLPKGVIITDDHYREWGIDPERVIAKTLRGSHPEYWLVVINEP